MTRTILYPKGGISIDNQIPTNVGTWRGIPVGGSDFFWQNQKERTYWICPSFGFLTDYEVKLQTAPGTSEYWDVTLRNDTTLEYIRFRISDLETSFKTGRSLRVSPGDEVFVQIIGSASAAGMGRITQKVNWMPDTPTEDVHTAFSISRTDPTLTEYANASSCSGIGWDTNTNHSAVYPMDATIKNLYIYRQRADALPNVGSKVDHHLIQNLGLSGEESILRVMDDTARTVTGSEELIMLEGDTLERRATPTNSPTAGKDTMAYAVDAGIGGKGMFLCGSINPLHISSTEYNFPQEGEGLWSTTLAEREFEFASDKRLTGFRILLDGAPGGAGDIYTFVLMRNGSPEASSTIAIEGTATTGEVTGLTIDCDTDDTLAIRCIPTDGGGLTARAATAMSISFEEQPSAPDLPTAVNWGYVDHLTDDSIRVTAELRDTESDGRLVISESSDLSVEDFVGDPIATTLMNFTGIGNRPIFRQTITGLDPVTQYYWGIKADGTTDLLHIGSFRTPDLPNVAPSSTRTYNIIFGADMESEFNPPGGLLGEVAALKRVKAVEDPDLFIFGGDFVYDDNPTPTTTPWTDVGLFRYRWRSQFVLDDVQDIFRMCPAAFQFDDHDGGADDFLTLDNANVKSQYLAAKQAFEELAPQGGPLAVSSTPAYEDPYVQLWKMGRIGFIVTDQFTYRSDTSNHVFGDGTEYGTPSVVSWDQISWIKQQMLQSQTDGTLLLIHPGGTSIEDSTSGWGIASAERKAIFDFACSNMVPEFVPIHGDAHRVFFDDGAEIQSYLTAGVLGRIPDYNIAPIKRSTNHGTGAKPWGVDADTRYSGDDEVYGKMVITDNPANYYITYTIEARNQDGTLINSTTYGNDDFTPEFTAGADIAIDDDQGQVLMRFDRDAGFGPRKVTAVTSDGGGANPDAVDTTDYVGINKVITSSGNAGFFDPIGIINRTGTNGLRDFTIDINTPSRCTIDVAAGADDQLVTLDDGVDAPIPDDREVVSLSFH